MGFILDMITDAIRHSNVNKQNQKNRGIVYYKPSQVGGFVEPDTCYGNTLVSGGDAQIRSEAIEGLCISAANAGLPVIVLHQGDRQCENTLKSTFSGFQNFCLANASNPVFDPIYGLSEHQICNAIVNSAPKRYNITSDGGAYVSALTGTLLSKLKKIPLPSLTALTKNDKITQLLLGGQLSPAIASTIQSRYTQGQKESNNVNQYLQTLYSECSSTLPKSMNAYKQCHSLNDIIQSCGVLVLDVVSDINNVYLRLLTELLNDIIRKGGQFMLIIDDLSISDDNGLKAFLSPKNTRVGKVLAGEDLFSSCCCDEKLFQSFLGRSQKWFIFNHMSSRSAEQWSKGIGIYTKIETSVNIGKGNATGVGVGTHHLGGNTSHHHQTGETLQLKDEEKIRPYEIQQLGPRQGIVYSGNQNELAFISQFIP